MGLLKIIKEARNPDNSEDLSGIDNFLVMSSTVTDDSVYQDFDVTEVSQKGKVYTKK